jgi:hypothetical protein
MINFPSIRFLESSPILSEANGIIPTLDPTHQNKECSWDREQGPKKTMSVGFSFKENLKFWFDA